MRYAEEQRPAAFRKMLQEMKPCFWDADIDALDMDENAPYIITRLLNAGGMAGYCWTVDLYPESAIAYAVIHRRDMHPIVRNFMASRCHIPKEQLVNAPAWR
ncbi:MAG: hypothetical protein IJ646_05395 [Clostridia bacterium]|nr:hypothetical protein [Clostridia bacterium]